MEENLIDKKIKTREELLQLIESDDAFTILFEENMLMFNELIKYELVSIKGEKIYLTDLGKEAQIHGVKNVIARKDVDKVISKIPEKPIFKVHRSYLILSFLFLFLALCLLTFHITSQPAQ